MFAFNKCMTLIQWCAVLVLVREAVVQSFSIKIFSLRNNRHGQQNNFPILGNRIATLF
jgi:hypothetical protein